MSLTLQDLRTRAQPWTQPITSEKPAGDSAKLDPAYELIVREVAKLESPSGGSVDWPRIVESGGALLKKNSKDLLIACYVAYGLYATAGLSGLLEGVSTLAELLDAFWNTLFPEVARLRARSNALSWFLQRTANALGQPEVRISDPELISGLELAAQRLAEVSRGRFGPSGPAFGPLLQSLERLKDSLPQQTASAGGSSPAPAAAAVPVVRIGAVAALTDPASAVEFLREIGDALTHAAEMIRHANAADPTSYRLLRTGIWVHIEQLPGGSNGRSPVPPLPPPLRNQLDKLSANGKWEVLLEESESALTRNRFNLDLHRFSAQALAGLGPPYQAARAALLTELGAWLRRMPAATELLHADGSPAADPQTRDWLHTQIQVSPLSPSTARAGSADTSAPLLEAAQALLSQGKLPDGLPSLEERIQALGAGRPRFEARLALAQLFAAAGQSALARALYGVLDEECTRHRLDQWEPALALQCLEGLLLSVRGLRGQAPLPPEFAGHYQRLCKLSLAAALRIQSQSG